MEKPKIEVNIKFFAFIAEKINKNEITLQVNRGVSIKELFDMIDDTLKFNLQNLLFQKNGKLKEQFSIVIDGNAVSNNLDRTLIENQNIFVFPPFSGGSIPEKHKKNAPKKIQFALETVSTSRYQLSLNSDNVSDQSAETAKKLIKKAGYEIIDYHILPDDKIQIQNRMKELKKPDVIIFMGGTGVAPDDLTPEALTPLFTKKLTSFNQLFTYLSHKQIGSACILSRATAGIYNKKLVVALPGSPDAVQLGLEKIILPEIGHILKLQNTKT